jgi:hypothetical protein
MAQDTRVCRFCLESKETKKNPLLEPCECKGSIQFVHERCLTRWRRMDPLRNADICLICLTPYFLLHPGTLETIPGEGYITVMLLRLPILLWCIVNYGILVQVSIQPNQNIADIFEIYQYVFQILYFSLVWKAWKVRNKVEYWSHWKNFSTTASIITLVWSNGALYQHQFVAIIPMNLILGILWHRHIQILRNMNMAL